MAEHSRTAAVFFRLNQVLHNRRSGKFLKNNKVEVCSIKRGVQHNSCVHYPPRIKKADRLSKRRVQV